MPWNYWNMHDLEMENRPTFIEKVHTIYVRIDWFFDSVVLFRSHAMLIILLVSILYCERIKSVGWLVFFFYIRNIYLKKNSFYTSSLYRGLRYENMLLIFHKVLCHNLQFYLSNVQREFIVYVAPRFKRSFCVNRNHLNSSLILRVN